MAQIIETRNLANQSNFSKNSQIFNSLMKTYEEIQRGGKKFVQKGGSGEMNLEAFSKFINCGQYRDKSQNTFDCKNINIPDTSGSVPLGTATTVDDKNITLEINEKQYNNDIKMVTVHMFVPKESQVIVKDYAKNTEAEMISSLPTGLPTSEPTGLPPPLSTMEGVSGQDDSARTDGFPESTTQGVSGPTVPEVQEPKKEEVSGSTTPVGSEQSEMENID